MTGDSQKPHLLYVAWGFPPSRGGGVYRALATANFFAETGWDVTVLTVDRETFLHTTGIDSTLENEINSSISVVRVPYGVPSTQVDLHSWSWARARFGELWMAQRVIRSLMKFPEPGSGSWRGKLEAAAAAVHKSKPVHLTIGTANPYIDFAAGHYLKVKHGIPHVLDYRDAWRLNVLTGTRVSDPGGLIASQERKLMRSADEVWFVNQPIRDWHAAEYPNYADKMKVVANGYDSKLVKFSAKAWTDTSPLVFGYIGTLYPEIPLKQALEGWRLARERSEILKASELRLYGYLGYTGNIQKELLDLIDSYRNDGVKHFGPVGKANIEATYEEFDAVLLAIGPGKYVTSGKVFEYAATGLPIVSVHDSASAASTVLADHPAWYLASDFAASSVADAFVAAAQRAVLISEQDKKSIQEWAIRFERRNQLMPRKAEIEANLLSLLQTQDATK